MDYININKNSWNAKVDYHLKSDFYFVEEFIAGRTSLNEPELELFGDIQGRKFCIWDVILVKILFLWREWEPSYFFSRFIRQSHLCQNIS